MIIFGNSRIKRLEMKSDQLEKRIDHFYRIIGFQSSVLTTLKKEVHEMTMTIDEIRAKIAEIHVAAGIDNTTVLSEINAAIEPVHNDLEATKALIGDLTDKNVALQETIAQLTLKLAGSDTPPVDTVAGDTVATDAVVG